MSGGVRRGQSLRDECKVSAVEAGIVITHPNRDTPETKAARALVIALFAVSIALMAIILMFGWSVLEGMFLVSFAYVIVYAILIWRVSQWARGPLAVGASLAIILAIFASIAFPTWGGRDAAGYASPETMWGSASLSPGVLGILTLVLAIVQVIVLVACVRAFRQEWQVEVEMPDGAAAASPTDGPSALDDPRMPDGDAAVEPDPERPSRDVW